MTASHSVDRQFHENLGILGSRIPVPAGPSGEVRSRCAAEFDAAPLSSRPRSFGVFRRPAVLSTLGLAACLALVVGLLFPSNGGPKVQAATILAKLNEQIEAPQLIEVTLEAIVLEELSVDGRIQVCETGLAGNVSVIVTEEAEKPPIEIDMSLALAPGKSWVLIRKLQIPEPQIQPLLMMVFPPGSELLLLLPDEVATDEFDLDFGDELRQLGSSRLLEAFQEMIRNQPDTGATITERPDGTLLMTLPIRDADAITGLIHVGITTAVEHVNVDADDMDAEVSIDDDNELIGSTLEIVYDPTTEQVRSFALKDFGASKGTISVVIREGGIDPALLDSSRVVTPNTRTFDLEALKSLFEGFDTGGDAGEETDEM